jgi:histidine triad (HIT) family protein
VLSITVVTSTIMLARLLRHLSPRLTMCGHTPLASWLLAFGFGCTLRTMTTGCVFCSIVEGTAAAERVYEDDFVVAIMDIHPATAGHVLVIPRNHSQDLWHIGREDAEKAMAAAVRIAGMIRRALGPGGINLVHATGHAAWQSVFHFHLHLVPRYEDDGLVPPWPLDQPRGEEASLRVVADKLRSVSVGAAATQASSQARPAG